MEDDHMIEALTANGSNHPFDIGSLPRRARCRQNFADAQVSHVFSKFIAKDCIAVTQQVARKLVKGKGLAQLLSRPRRGRVGSHIEARATPLGWLCDPETLSELDGVDTGADLAQLESEAQPGSAAKAAFSLGAFLPDLRAWLRYWRLCRWWRALS